MPYKAENELIYILQENGLMTARGNKTKNLPASASNIVTKLVKMLRIFFSLLSFF